MPHSHSTSESPIRRKKDRHRHKHHHENKKKRHHSASDDDQSRQIATKRMKHKKERHHRDNDDIKQEPDDRLLRKIKQEPDDEFMEQRHERAHRDEERRDNHRRRNRDGLDDFGRSNDNSYPVNIKSESQNSQHESHDHRKVKKEKEKEKPNFEVSGKLADETNTYRGVVVKYNEPPEARKPKKRWRLFPFKGDEPLPPLPIHRQSAYLLGRCRIVADIPTDHPSCSKQHAAFQYRMVSYDRDDGTNGRCVRPYVIDLDSANGTYVNNNRIEARCYVELREKDVIKFGFSSREYVLLHDKSDTAELFEDDDQGEEES